MKLSVAVVVCLVFIALSGCATLAPQRHNANLLMGKDIGEAYKYFGNPVMTMTEHLPGPREGQTIYLFQTNRGLRSRTRPVGSEYSVANGRPEIINYYKKETIEIACNTLLWVNQDNIIDYYEMKGNCGAGGWGFGNTGVLHGIGIN